MSRWIANIFFRYIQVMNTFRILGMKSISVTNDKETLFYTIWRWHFGDFPHSKTI